MTEQPEQPVMCQCGQPAHPQFLPQCENCWAEDQYPSVRTLDSEFKGRQAWNTDRHWERKKPEIQGG